SLVCRVGNPNQQQSIHVEFLRLSEAAAGSLVMQEPHEKLQRVLGTPRLLSNPVQNEVRNLFDKFGTRLSTADCALKIETPQGGRDYGSRRDDEPFQKRCENKDQVLWFFSFPDHSSSISIPLPSETRQIQTALNWPSNFNF